MSTQSTTPISGASAGAREAARQHNGQFGAQLRPEGDVVDLMAGSAYDTRPVDMKMDCDEFEEMFGGHVEAPSGNAMWSSDEIDASGLPDDRVWTVVENGENENLNLLPGRHHVNRVDYVVSEQPWGNPNIEVLWHDENDMGVEDHPADTTVDPAAYSEFGDNEGWAQLNTTPALAPRTDAALARLEEAARQVKADPMDSSARMARNSYIEALAMSREGRMMLQGMSDDQLGGELYGNERESLVDHGKKKSTKLHDHFNKTGLGAGATPTTIAEARRTLREGAQVEVVYLGKYAPTQDGEHDFRVVASQSERTMETLRRGEATPVRNDWHRKTAMVDANDNIIVCDEFGVPYVAYRHVN